MILLELTLFLQNNIKSYSFCDNKFLSIIKGGNYNCCLSTYCNSKVIDIKNFIKLCSLKFKISTWDSIIQYCSDDEILSMIENQKKNEAEFIERILNLDISTNYGTKIN